MRHVRSGFTMILGGIVAASLIMGGCRGSGGSEPDDEPMIDPIPASMIPDAPVLSPKEAIADFVVEDGFSVELVAAEPDVVAPVALTFDGNGAIWVAEMRAYMENVEGSTEDKPIGAIRVLRDLDGDHHYETISTFLDGLVLPRAIAIANGGLLVAEPPNLWHYAIDNYQAGARTLVDSTYAVGGNPEHQPNGLLRAIDNWIYSAKSDIRYRYRDGSWQKDTTEYRGQWGITQDDYGRLFYNHNSATLLGDNLTPGVMRYNPNHSTTSRNFSASKASNKVYPIRINPGVNRAYRSETLDDVGKLDNMTAACGPVIYRGDSFDDSYYGNAFIMEPAANLIKRVVLSDDDGVVTGSFPYEGREFLASTDERFRPVNSYTAPDGSLFIVDMYRGVIQHKTYLTPYLQRQIEARGLAEPVDLGRIYRIRQTQRDLDQPPRLLEASTAELVQTLRHKNGWRRDTAQQLLVESGDESAAPLLRTVAMDRGNPVAQLHALWTLEGLGVLTVSDLSNVLRRAPDSKVVTHIVRLASQFTDPVVAPDALALIEGISDSGREVTLSRTLGLLAFIGVDDERVMASVTEIARSKGNDAEFVDAIVGGLAGREVSFLEKYSTPEAADTRLTGALQESRFADQTRPAREYLALNETHREQFERGRTVYARDCSVCHGNNGRGLAATAPTLVRSSWVLQNPEVTAKIILDGLTGPVTVNGTEVSAPDILDVMPGFRRTDAMTDEDLSALITYIRNQWGNRATPVSKADVQRIRKATRSHADQPYTADELAQTTEPGMSPLIADSDLSEFEILGGTATYRFEDGVLTGTTVPSSPNTFLATRREYANFVLEFEVLVDPEINSGVQIRSHSRPDYNNGRVHGLQIEIDPSARAWSAGIYEEGRRGWLFDLRGNRAAREAFKQNEWNHYRIEANGPHVRTWLNGVLAADFIDEMDPSGFIAFQVHGVAAQHVGKEIKWRSIRLREIN